jgi:hypothetical protein
MAFLREKRSRLSPFPAARSLSLNSPASMLAKVSSEHEGRREMVFLVISFFPAAMDLKVFFDERDDLKLLRRERRSQTGVRREWRATSV